MCKKYMMFICISYIYVCVCILFSNGINNVCKLRGQFYFIVNHPMPLLCVHLNPHFVVIYTFTIFFFMVFAVCIQQWYVVVFRCFFTLLRFLLFYAEDLVNKTEYFPITNDMAQYSVDVNVVECYANIWIEFRLHHYGDLTQQKRILCAGFCCRCCWILLSFLLKLGL